jgi:hypothetical protein
MDPIMDQIQALRIEVQYILGGCVYLCQCENVSANNPIKKEMMEQWEDGMTEGGGVKAKVAKTAMRQIVVQ